jgi:hypothetical protein
MAVQNTKRFIKDLHKFVGNSVRKNLNSFYTEVTMTNTSVGQGFKEGYQSLADAYEDYIDIPDSEFNKFGTEAIEKLHTYVTAERTFPVLVDYIPGKLIKYAARRDIKKAYTIVKNSGTSSLNKYLKGKGKRALRGLKEEQGAGKNITNPVQSEVGRFKSALHRTHESITTVGAAQLTAALTFLDKTASFSGYAKSKQFRDIMSVYEDVEYIFETTGTKKDGAKISLKEDQSIRIILGPRSRNKVGSEPTDWKNTRPLLEQAIVAYIEKTQIEKRPGSKSIEETTEDVAEYNILKELKKAKNVTGNNPKPETRKKQKVRSVQNNKKTKSTAPRKKAPKKAKTIVPTSTNILSLAALINQKLPETIRKNMNPPALENRTGRFANSVKIVEAAYTAQGYPSFGYTYQKDPYQVFEPSLGNPRWSSQERDPKRLIDRSIREIAVQLMSGRFFTRRL